MVGSANAGVVGFDDPSGPGSGGDFTNLVAGRCRIALDGIQIGAFSQVVLHGTVSDSDALAVNRVTLPLDPGLHTFALRCTEIDGIIFWEEASISAVMLGSD